MNELSRLLSGRQIRLHASRLSRRPGGAAQQQQRRRPPRAEGDAGADDEEEDWGVEDEDENEGRGKGEPHDADADADADEDEEADALLEGEAPQGQYYRNSALAKPRWAGRAASPPEALAYLATRAVPNFSVALRVLREAGAAAARAGLAGGGATPASVLDVGCGPGSGLLAARTLWGGGGGRLRRLDGVDHSGAMRDLARHLLEPDAVVGGGQAQEQAQAQGQDGQQQPQQEPPAPVTLHRHLPPLAQQAARTGERYDVVLASWTLSELPSDASRALAVGLMWELVATNGGVLVLVEDGSPEGSRLVRSARRLVLEKRGPPEGGRGGGGGGAGAGAGPDAAVARTLAPCPHDRPCPLLRDDWCRFTQRVPLGRLPRGAGGGGGGHGAAGGGGGRRGGGGGGYKDVAFSYVVLQKGRSQGGAAVPGTENCDADARLAALRRLRVAEEEPERGVYAPTEADWEAATEGVPSRNGWARLIRNPKKAKGHVHLDLCLPTGRLERRVVAKSAAKRLPGKYVAARKAQWGGLWPAAKDV